MNQCSKFVAFAALVVCLSAAPQSALAQSTMSLTFAPTKVTDATSVCPGSITTPITKLSGKSLVGSTKKTAPQTAGILYYSETNGTGLGVHYTNAKLLVTCRGNGTIRVVTQNCLTEVTHVDCYAGTRPVAEASPAFLLTGDNDYDLQVQATNDGDVLEFAEPKLLVY